MSTGDEASTTSLPAAFARTAVVDAATKRLNALERLAAFPASRSTNTATRGAALKLVQDPCALIEVDDANAGNDWSTVFVAAWFAVM